MNVLHRLAALFLCLPISVQAAPLGLSGSAPSYRSEIGKTIAPWDIPGYDIVLLAGQSNMAGRGAYDATIDGIPDPRVSQFGGYASGPYYQTIISGADPLQFPEAVENGLLGPGTWFARAYANSIAPNRRVLLVPVAWGGTSLATATSQNNAACGTTPCWSPTAPGLLYTNAIAQANAAVAAAQAQFPGSRFVGTLWVQGETDANTAQATYAAALDALIAGFRANITGAQNSWFVLGSMLPEYIVGTSGSINAAHVDTPRRNAFTALAPSAGPGYMLTTDGLNVHYNAAGQRLQGLSLFNAVAAAKANTVAGSAPTPIALPGQPAALAIGTPSGASLPLTWSAPTSGGAVSKYIVQYRQTGSSTWSIGGSSASPSLTIVVPSYSTGYDVRVFAYNASGVGTASATASATSGVYTQISPTLSQGSYLFAHEYASGATSDYRGATTVALSGNAAISPSQVNGKSALVMAQATNDYATITGGGVSNVGGSKTGTTTCVIAGKLTAAVTASNQYLMTGGNATAGGAAGAPFSGIATTTSWLFRARTPDSASTYTATATTPVPSAGPAFVVATRYINDGTSITTQINVNGAGWINGTGTAPAVGSIASTFTRFDLNAAAFSGGATVAGNMAVVYDTCMQGESAADDTAVINTYKTALGVP
jgi:hypothetical protein